MLSTKFNNEKNSISRAQTSIAPNYLHRTGYIFIAIGLLLAIYKFGKYVRLAVCLSVCMSVSLSVSLSLCRRFDLSTFWFVDVLVCRRFGLSTFRFVEVSVHWSFGHSTFRSVEVSVCRRYVFWRECCQCFGLLTFWPVTPIALIAIVNDASHCSVTFCNNGYHKNDTMAVSVTLQRQEIKWHGSIFSALFP